MDNAGIHAGFLAAAIDDWLSGRSTEASAFATYHRQRDDHAMDGFESTAREGRDLSALISQA